MQYFDLNVPYSDGDRKENRLKVVVKAMELGYSGIAYNRTIKGSSMSQLDRCNIPTFPLSSLLKVSPSLSSTVSFHRRLLSLPNTSPFRQYSRLTVIVETTPQASALNSSNPVLKTYDLVGVRPLNQNTFDHACHSSHVHLISIDFSDKLPFRLKLPLVKAALARGVYFEITYSSLMEDVRIRRHLISNAKLLVEWTRGRNIIVSSAAPSVLQLRGPNDVANLSSLLGLSEEHAKAAISKNCRLLISNALRKKHFYKEAIRVEVMPAGTQTDPKDPWIVDSYDWDPISSGEGDLRVDDMAESFARLSQTVKAIDFDSIVNIEPSQANGLDFRVEGASLSSYIVTEDACGSNDLKPSKEIEKTQRELTQSSHLDQQSNAGYESDHAIPPDSPKDGFIQEGMGKSSTNYLDGIEKPGAVEAIISPADRSENMLVGSNVEETCSRYIDSDVGCNVHVENFSIRSEDLSFPAEERGSTPLVSCALNKVEVGVSDEIQLDQSVSADMSLSGHVMPMDVDHVNDTNSTLHADKMIDLGSSFGCDGGSSSLGDLQGLNYKEQKEDNTEIKLDATLSLLSDTTMQIDSFLGSNIGEDKSVAKSIPSEGLATEARSQSVANEKAGTHKHNHRLSCKVLRFPFKRLFQVQLKKKGAMSSYKIKKR